MLGSSMHLLRGKGGRGFFMRLKNRIMNLIFVIG